MNDTDLSDEAAIAMAKAMFADCEADFVGGWLECRARAQIQLEKKRREAFGAGMYSMAYPGYIFSTDHIETAYRAFLQEKEGK